VQPRDPPRSISAHAEWRRRGYTAAQGNRIRRSVTSRKGNWTDRAHMVAITARLQLDNAEADVRHAQARPDASSRSRRREAVVRQLEGVWRDEGRHLNNTIVVPDGRPQVERNVEVRRVRHTTASSANAARRGYVVSNR